MSDVSDLPPVPRNPNVPAPIQKCFCGICGRVAPSWFHSDFILMHDGFICRWCAIDARTDKETT